MTPAELSAALAALGISERGVARAIGADERTVRRWTAGTAPIPGSLALLIELALELQPLADRLAALAAPDRGRLGRRAGPMTARRACGPCS